MKKILKFFVVIGISIMFMSIIGCDCDGSSIKDGYEFIKTKDGEILHKIEVFCPGESKRVFLTTRSYGVSDQNSYVYFYDYTTGIKIKTSCPVFAAPVIQKKPNSGVSVEERILKEDDQRPLTKGLPSNDIQGTTNNITINNNITK